MSPELSHTKFWALIVNQNHALDAWFGKNYIVEEDIKTPLFQDCFAGVLRLSLTSGGRSRRAFGFPNAMLAKLRASRTLDVGVQSRCL